MRRTTVATARAMEVIMVRSNALNDLPALEKFITGVKRLKDPALHPYPGQPQLSIYDSFVEWHLKSMMTFTPVGQNDRNAAHSGPVFLPWHRYFLLRLESLLRETLNDPDFRIPYWDWNADAKLQNPRGSLIWDDQYLGQFTDGSWRVRLTTNAAMQMIGVNRKLRRRLGGASALPTQAGVREVIRTYTTYDASPFDSLSFDGVRNYIEGNVGNESIHNSVHNWIGGDMATSASPNDPVFYLHHCNVDRLWAAWQEKYPAAPYVPGANASPTYTFHRIDDPMYSPFEEKVKVRQVLDYKQYYTFDYLDDLL